MNMLPTAIDINPIYVYGDEINQIIVDTYQANDKIALMTNTVEGLPFSRITTNLTQYNFDNHIVTVEPSHTNNVFMDELIKKGFAIKLARTVRQNFGEYQLYELTPAFFDAVNS